jgi:hypothetical protein
VNGFRNLTLSHNKTLTAKIDHKNEISAKNWVGSTWVAKSQLWKKSTLFVKSQLKKLMPVKSQHPVKVVKKSTPVNVSQRSKSTLVNG